MRIFNRRQKEEQETPEAPSVRQAPASDSAAKHPAPLNQEFLPAPEDKASLTGGFPDSQVKLICEICFPQNVSVSDREIQNCLATARHYGLNPLTQEIRFISTKVHRRGREYWEVKPLVGRDGLLVLAHRTGLFAGIESWVEYKPWPKWNEQVQNFDHIEQPVGISRVWTIGSDHPTIVSVGFWEYAMRNDGSVDPFYKKMGPTMITKVADCQALRKAFQLSGLYSPEELNAGYLDSEGTFRQEQTPPQNQSQSQSEPTPAANQADPDPAPEQALEPQEHQQPSLRDRLLAVRKDFVGKFGFLDITRRLGELEEGALYFNDDGTLASSVEKEQGSTPAGFIVFHMDDQVGTVSVWTQPSSPYTTTLHGSGFNEDLASGWWTLTLN